MSDAQGAETILTLTPEAIEAVKRVRAKSGVSADHAFRVAVVGGGCSGYSYQLDFDDKARDGDAVIEYDGVTVRVDPESQQFLRGITIDFVSKLSGGGFKFVNPVATGTCGCGTSFSVDGNSAS